MWRSRISRTAAPWRGTRRRRSPHPGAGCLHRAPRGIERRRSLTIDTRVASHTRIHIWTPPACRTSPQVSRDPLLLLSVQPSVRYQCGRADLDDTNRPCRPQRRPRHCVGPDLGRCGQPFRDLHTRCHRDGRRRNDRAHRRRAATLHLTVPAAEPEEPDRGGGGRRRLGPGLPRRPARPRAGRGVGPRPPPGCRARCRPGRLATRGICLTDARPRHRRRRRGGRRGR